LQTPNSDKIKLKLANLLPKRLSHNYGTNLPGTIDAKLQINSWGLSCQTSSTCYGCMTHTAPGGSLAPDMNTQALTYLHAYLLDLPCRVRE